MEEKKGLERREFLKRAAVTGATAAWAAPLVQTVAATPAFAQTAGTVVTEECEHSPNEDNEFNDVPGENCMATCKAACGTATGCSAICKCTRGVCPPQYCNQACYQCVNGSPVFVC